VGNNPVLAGVTQSEMQLIPQMNYNNEAMENMLHITQAQSNVLPTKYMEHMSTFFEQQTKKALEELKHKHE
jgi:ubiquinone biosynthesis protein COQ9